MKVLIRIDDRGNIAAMGNRELKEYLVRIIEERGWGVCSGVTSREVCVPHVTSYAFHSFKTDIEQSKLEEAIGFVSSFLTMDCVLLPYSSAVE